LKTAEPLRWSELPGLLIAPLALLPQACFMSYVVLFPDGQLGGIHYTAPSVGLESGFSGRLLWWLWALWTTPVAFAQALVVTPLVCLWLLRRPGRARRRVVAISLAISVLTLILSCLIVAFL